MDPDVTWGRGRGCPLVVHYWADLQARVALLWQHNMNRCYRLASIPQYDDTVQMLGAVCANGHLGGVCARCWPVTGGVLKIPRRKMLGVHACTRSVPS